MLTKKQLTAGKAKSVKKERKLDSRGAREGERRTKSEPPPPLLNEPPPVNHHPGVTKGMVSSR